MPLNKNDKIYFVADKKRQGTKDYILL